MRCWNHWGPWAWVGAILLTGGIAHRGEGQAQVPGLRPVAVTPWQGQATWSGRVVVEEHTTGLRCEPCQFVEEAADGLLRRYPARVLISLAFHQSLDFSLSDPVDGGWTAFGRWYGNPYGKCFEQKPDCYVPGQIPRALDSLIPDGLIGGRNVLPYYGNISDTMSQSMYDRMARAADAELQRTPEAFFHVGTTMQGGRIQVRFQLDSLRGSHPRTYLRLLLVEDTVALRAKFMRSEVHMVVRAYAHTPTLAMGLPLPGPGAQQYTFDVTAIQRRLLQLHRGDTLLIKQGMINDPVACGGDPKQADGLYEWYRETYPRDDPYDQDWRVDPRRLHVVALVQDATTGAVLQAAMVPVNR